MANASILIQITSEVGMGIVKNLAIPVPLSILLINSVLLSILIQLCIVQMALVAVTL